MHFYQLVRNPLIETEHNEIDVRICHVAIFPIVGGKKKKILQLRLLPSQIWINDFNLNKCFHLFVALVLIS